MCRRGYSFVKTIDLTQMNVKIYTMGVALYNGCGFNFQENEASYDSHINT